MRRCAIHHSGHIAPARGGPLSPWPTAGSVDALGFLGDPNGVDGTTVDDIAARAGISPRTFFRYCEATEAAR